MLTMVTIFGCSPYHLPDNKVLTQKEGMMVNMGYCNITCAPSLR